MNLKGQKDRKCNSVYLGGDELSIMILKLNPVGVDVVPGGARGRGVEGQFQSSLF